MRSSVCILAGSGAPEARLDLWRPLFVVFFYGNENQAVVGRAAEWLE